MSRERAMQGRVPRVSPVSILFENRLDLKKLQGDFGHYRENNQSILSKVAKIALNIFYKLKVFAYKIVAPASLQQ